MRIPAWLSERFDFANGLDYGLLGILVAIIGVYLGSVAKAGSYMPNLLRFSDYAGPNDMPPLATMPQDSALLLMLDEGSKASQSTGVEQVIVLPELATPVIVTIGLVIAIIGPTWYWLGKPAFFRNVEQVEEP